MSATAPLEKLFAERGWTPFVFQLEAWRYFLDGRSGLVHAPTGSGKTLSVFGGPLAERLQREVTPPRKRSRGEPHAVLWITPMRALANDTAHALTRMIEAAGLDWSVELRTSDTSQSVRKRQRDRLPTVLVTTPESLSVLLSYPNARQSFTGLQSVIVDEWHELMSTKRGVQAELGIARLRQFNPQLRTWGLSATLGNLDQALATLCPDGGVMVHGDASKPIEVRTLLPESIERFPWGGHMGLRMADAVVAELERGGTSLVFANTRAQVEVWFRTILAKRPDWLGEIAIHHGSLDRKIRIEVEGLLREGRLRAVVCTSSLDLGVDYPAVDRVVQIGSPKGIARLIQRAGRSGHTPGLTSTVICVPTHAFELVEFSAAREGVERKSVEPRLPLRKPLDVLAQHVVTVAAGGGFDADELLSEVRTAAAFAELTDEEWQWVLDFVERGGPTLDAYPQFRKVVRRPDGRYVIGDDKLARLHRLGIGTITSDGVVALQLRNGKRLGTIEEAFIGKLKPGDTFTFAGRPLEFVSMRDMAATVRPAKSKRGSVPSWAGGRFPLSTLLADAVRDRLESAREGDHADLEMRTIAPLLNVQHAWSHLPGNGELLIESIHTREGDHHFLYPLLGRLVHEGLGSVIAHRIGRRFDVSITASFTDYGIELLASGPLKLDEPTWRSLLSADGLLDDLLACLNAGELTKRQFRDISRVAGLVLATSPGAPKSTRQLQASAQLFFDVFIEFDPQNLLLEQARREVLERQLEIDRLAAALADLRNQKLILTEPGRLTPMAFPIWAQRISSQTIRVEAAADRIERMMRQLERAAG
ncbi:MAG: ligase-associated DNA damage response DEXH box helicase [Planctomycetota bacterium]